MIKIWDISAGEYWQDEDGEDLLFVDEIAAKNMMFTEGYKYEYVQTGVEFHPFSPIDKTGYDLQ